MLSGLGADITEKKTPFGSQQPLNMILHFLSNEHLCRRYGVFLTGESYGIKNPNENLTEGIVFYHVSSHPFFKVY